MVVLGSELGGMQKIMCVDVFEKLIYSTHCFASHWVLPKIMEKNWSPSSSKNLTLKNDFIMPYLFIYLFIYLFSLVGQNSLYSL